VTDLEFCDGGMRVHIRRSKTDQEGAGDTIAIAWGSVACPVNAVRAWLEASNVSTGPLLRPITKGGRIGTGRLADITVVRVVKASAQWGPKSLATRRARCKPLASQPNSARCATKRCYLFSACESPTALIRCRALFDKRPSLADNRPQCDPPVIQPARMPGFCLLRYTDRVGGRPSRFGRRSHL
jgi:hypothetical protein